MSTGPKKYRKKPVEIEAVHFTDVAAGSRIAQWCGGTNVDSPHEIRIETLEGTMTAVLGDWIIRGVKGESTRASRTSSPPHTTR